MNDSIDKRLGPKPKPAHVSEYLARVGKNELALRALEAQKQKPKYQFFHYRLDGLREKKTKEPISYNAPVYK